MKEPMTAREFALIFWGPIIVIGLVIGAWMTMAEFNRANQAAADAAQSMAAQNARLEQNARDNPAP